jgi:hypothetical protein
MIIRIIRYHTAKLLLMTTLEQLLQGKTNIISRNPEIRLVESEPRFKEKNGLSYCHFNAGFRRDTKES